MGMKNLEDLFEHGLKDIYHAKKQIVKEPPKMARKADSAELRKAFEEHEAETQQHIANLEKVCEKLDLAKRGNRLASQPSTQARGRFTPVRGRASVAPLCEGDG